MTPNREGSPRSADQTDCVIVGAGPAGAMLGLMLARRGASVTLLERHADFDRDFRGDTLPPGSLEILDQLGLAERTLALATSRLSTLVLRYPGAELEVADLRRLRTRFPFVALVPQARFLELVAAEAERQPGFRLVRGADVQQLVDESGVVRGVRYVNGAGELVEARAPLVVATDGRHSKLRRLAGATARGSSPEIDLLWFRVPRRDGQRGGAYLAAGGYLIALERDDAWQIGFVIRKDSFGEWRERGLDALRAAASDLAPDLAPSIAALTDWRDVKPLSVQADRLTRWHRPGLLFLGDAAHVMSPVGGVGIQCAIQDAVEAANRLAEPIRARRVDEHRLRSVQRRRAWAVRLVQRLQAFDQTHLIDAAMRSRGAYRLPVWLRTLVKIPWIGSWPARLFAFGPRRERVQD